MEKKSKKTLEVGGWVKCSIGNLKKLENIFLNILLLRFWASIRTSITTINALLCLCSCFYVQVLVVTFEIFGLFWIEGWVGGWGVSYPNCFGFLYF